jgi:hypothetical protein
VIIASVTARLDRVPKFFPKVAHVAPPDPALTHQHMHQILVPSAKAPPRKKCHRKIDDLVADYRLRMLGSQGRDLVVTHKAYEAAFKGISGLATRHHGDVAMTITAMSSTSSSLAVRSLGRARSPAASAPRPGTGCSKKSLCACLASGC